MNSKEQGVVRSFGELIAYRRTSLGLGQKDLAIRAGIGQSTISKIENDATEASVGIVNKLANALNADVSDLLYYKSKLTLLSEDAPGLDVRYAFMGTDIASSYEISKANGLKIVDEAQIRRDEKLNKHAETFAKLVVEGARKDSLGSQLDTSKTSPNVNLTQILAAFPPDQKFDLARFELSFEDIVKAVAYYNDAHKPKHSNSKKKQLAEMEDILKDIRENGPAHLRNKNQSKKA